MGFNFNFLKDLDSETRAIKNLGRSSKKVVSKAKKPAGKAVRFLANPVNTLTAPAQAAREVVKRATGKNLPNVPKFIRETGQSIARVPETVARSYVENQVGGIYKKAGVKKDFSSGKVTDPLRKFAYGEEPVQTYQKRAEGNKKVLEGSRFKGAAAPLTFLAAGLTIGGDVTGYGGAKKAAGREIAERLAKETTEQGVKKIVGKEVAPELASALTRTKDANITENLIRGDNRIPNPPPQMVPPVTKPLQESQDIVSATVPKAPKSPTVISRSPSESPELSDLVKRGKLQRTGETAPINSLKLGSDTKGTYDGDQVKKYVTDIKQGRTIDPIVIDSKGFVSDGKHRLEAMRQLGVKDVPVVQKIDAPKLTGAAQQSSLAKNDPFKVVGEAITGKPAASGQAPVKGIATARKEQNELLSRERGQRFTAQKKVGETADGYEGYLKEKATLKGSYTKVKNPYADKFTPEDAKQIFMDARKKIIATPDSVYERDWKKYGLNGPKYAQAARFNTQTAVAKALGLEPGLPTDSELKLLRVHAPKLADEMETLIPKSRQLFDFAADVAGSSRALRSGADLSMGGRQGLFVAARHPVQWAQANKASVKFAKNEEHYYKRMREIADDPWIQAGNDHDIGLQGVKGLKEEAYNSSDLASKVPGIRRAERAYTGGLSELRASLWKKNLQRYGKTPEEAAAKLGEKGMEGLAETVRTLTGRGGKTGGFVEKRAKTLGEALFSPRLWASRLQPFNPAYWKRIGPAGRREAFQSLAAFAVVAGTVLEAAHIAGAEVETDARSSDFLKIKVGDTRYDVLGGFQQNLVFGWRQLTGEKKNSQTGKVTTFARDIGDVIAGKKKEDVVDPGPFTGNRLTATVDLVSNKAAPIPAAGLKIIAGEDKSGNDVNPLTEIGALFVPIGLQNTWQNAQRENPVSSIAKGAPEFFGIGSQTYGIKDLNVTSGQKEYLTKLEEKKAPKEQIEASESFFQYIKAAPSKEEATKEIKRALEAKDTTKAKTLAKEYNSKYADSFKDWREKYPQYRKDKTLLKEFQRNKITSETLKRYLATIKKETL